MKKVFLALVAFLLLNGCASISPNKSVVEIQPQNLNIQNINQANDNNLAYPYADGQFEEAQRLIADRTIRRIFDEVVFATKQHYDLCNNVLGPNEESYLSPDGKREISSSYREYITYVDYNYFRVDLYPYRASACDLYIYEVLTPVKDGNTTVKIKYEGNYENSNLPLGIKSSGEKTYNLKIVE